MTRFELATPATRTQCATRLRYIPILLKSQNFRFARVRYPSLKSIINRFVRQSATSRNILFNFYITIIHPEKIFVNPNCKIL